ncbi:hypothetical protein D3C71_1799230 [compost metagenome]
MTVVEPTSIPMIKELAGWVMTFMNTSPASVCFQLIYTKGLYFITIYNKSNNFLFLDYSIDSCKMLTYKKAAGTFPTA